MIKRQPLNDAINGSLIERLRYLPSLIDPYFRVVKVSWWCILEQLEPRDLQGHDAQSDTKEPLPAGSEVQAGRKEPLHNDEDVLGAGIRLLREDPKSSDARYVLARCDCSHRKRRYERLSLACRRQQRSRIERSANLHDPSENEAS